MPTLFGNIYTTLNNLPDGTPVEVFSTIGKSGADMESCTEAIGRLLSLLLRYKVPPSEMVEQMKGISGSQPVWDGDGKSVLSIPDAIARSLEHLTGDVRTVKSGELCPECGGMTERGEGCLKCPECGWSRC
jgi:ribonucleoside-diphosphate reductase alpha chain